MSILANLLKKSDEPQNSGQIPPGLLKSLASGNSRRLQRRTYLLIAAGGVASVVCGVLLLLYLQNRPDASQKMVFRPTPVPQAPAVAASGEIKALPVVPEVKAPVMGEGRTAGHESTKTIVRDAVSGKHSVSQKAPVSRSVATVKRAVSPKDRATADAYLFAARTAESKNDYQQALKLYRQALTTNPYNHHILNNIASSLIRVGQYDEALLFVIRALTLKDDYVSALVNGGIAYSVRGDDAAAINMFSRAVALEPSNKSTLYNLALSQEKSGLREEALTSFRRLADLGDAKGYLGMARILEGKGNRSEAVRLYREIIGMSTADDAARSVARKRIVILE
ncbi:MAG: tetratricopeptide repeat protein [Desulfuromonadaceae bacterium]|nr:tetratricopeptide repeat protein [Desulfuromonadaceae bacterium]MDD2848799.1 tetratricopeptide repeat protein [Desulfuromonadaceae bacterium]MDD4130449.1 tetratricopeptide repeat protein [Desulfuromonadaceae bacterium]